MNKARLERYRQDVLREVLRGQADVQFLKMLDRYRQEVRTQALEEAAQAVQQLPRRNVVEDDDSDEGFERRMREAGKAAAEGR